MNLMDPAVIGATLKDLLRTDSGRMLAESAYLKARLSDRVPQAGREISLLVEAQSAGIPQTLRASWASESLRASLASKLAAERGLSATAANWAVDSWAAALDVRFSADPPKVIPVPHPPTPPVPYPPGPTPPNPQPFRAEGLTMGKMFSKTSGIIGAIVGVAVGSYSGINLLIPLAATFIFGWVASKQVKGEAKPFVPAFAVQAGQGLWMLLGFIMLGVFNANALDLVVLAIGLTWLLMRPGLGPAILLGAYQCIALVINLRTFFDVGFGSEMNKALLVHLIFRILAVVFMVVGLQDMRRRSAAAVRAPLAAEGGNANW